MMCVGVSNYYYFLLVTDGNLELEGGHVMASRFNFIIVVVVTTFYLGFYIHVSFQMKKTSSCIYLFITRRLLQISSQCHFLWTN
jgi:hypothetical protein